MTQVQITLGKAQPPIVKNYEGSTRILTQRNLQTDKTHPSIRGRAKSGADRTTKKVGAGEGNRTLVFSLEGCCSTIELHPHRPTLKKRNKVGTALLALTVLTSSLWPRVAEGVAWWGKQDSNLRRHSQRIYSPPPLPLGTFPRAPAHARP